MPSTPPDLLPRNEAMRLSTLHHYNVLASQQEPVFDRFVELAAQLFDLPISLLTFVAADRVLYKAAYGQVGLVQHARDETICSVAVARRQVVVFTDLAQPGQQHCLPAEARAAACAGGLRFYAGVPLQMPNHYVIGTLCVMGRQPRTISPQELQVLEQLAHLVEKVIVVRHACLSSSSLGPEHWQLVQAYIADELHELTARVRGLVGQLGPQVPVQSAVLITAIQHLNNLGAVLAEPLPTLA